ncbi:MAG: hypothetical protein LOD84_09080 [Limnochordales bacterium]
MDLFGIYGFGARAATAGDSYAFALAAATAATTATSAGTGATEQKDAAGGDILGKDDFLRLLITQLRYQDPIKPVQDQEFIAQLAQFSALEQMHNMARQMERLADAQLGVGGLGHAVSLLGRTVVILDPETGGMVTGRVDSVRMRGGQPWLVVGEREFSVLDVVEVRPDGAAK